MAGLEMLRTHLHAWLIYGRLTLGFIQLNTTLRTTLSPVQTSTCWVLAKRAL